VITDAALGTEPGARAPAPEPVRLVQRFLNSVDIEEGTDAIDTPAGLRAWLGSVGLPGSRGTASSADVARVLRLREAIRDLLEARTHRVLDGSPARRFDREVRAVPLRLRSSGDRLDLVPNAAGLDGALATIVGVLARADADGSLARFKVCANDVCRWAYWDGSRNRSGTWCTMAICGNRIKGRAFRRRTRPGSAS
jgi:predicted RNA-binding Zn ribbon-like protein